MSSWNLFYTPATLARLNPDQTVLEPGCGVTLQVLSELISLIQDISILQNAVAEPDWEHQDPWGARCYIINITPDMWQALGQGGLIRIINL